MKLRNTRTGKLNVRALKRAGLSGAVHMVPCPGEAHSNAHIDHCMLCAPEWGVIEVPAEHAGIDVWRDWYLAKFPSRTTIVVRR